MEFDKKNLDIEGYGKKSGRNSKMSSKKKGTIFIFQHLRYANLRDTRQQSHMFEVRTASGRNKQDTHSQASAPPMEREG
jgi:hypothetical protein